MTTAPVTEYKRALEDPKPAAWHARNAPQSRWCQVCRLPSQQEICRTCRAESDAEPSPLPASWAAYTPDMSCYVTSPEPETAGEIDCRPLLDLLQQEPPQHGAGYVLYRYSGNLPPAAQDALSRYMERIHSRVHEQREAVMYIYSRGDIYLTVYLPHRPSGVSLISLWDYGVASPSPAPVAAVQPSGWLQRIGGVA